jgi:hypothetical protein
MTRVKSRNVHVLHDNREPWQFGPGEHLLANDREGIIAPERRDPDAEARARREMLTPTRLELDPETNLGAATALTG